MPCAVDNFKLCPRCNNTKHISNYYHRKSSKDGLYSYCKSCNYEYRLQHPCIGGQKRYIAKLKQRRLHLIYSPKATKQCIHCKITKLLTDFHIGFAKYGRNSVCKVCRCSEINKEYRSNPESKGRKRQRKNKLKKFGLSIEQYQILLKKQNETCAICNKSETSTLNGNIKPLSIDHCHSKSSHVRGLLCAKCNCGLGYFLDDIKLLRNAIRYLVQDHNRASRRSTIS